jgi:hypothetical protein
MGSEYSNGTIAFTLAAVPNRLQALAAKALAVTLVAFALGVVPSLAAYALTIGTRDPDAQRRHSDHGLRRDPARAPSPRRPDPRPRRRHGVRTPTHDSRPNPHGHGRQYHPAPR